MIRLTSPAARLGAYGVVLAVAFGGGALVGAAVGPDVDPVPVHHPAPAEPAPSAGATDDGH